MRATHISTAVKGMVFGRFNSDQGYRNQKIWLTVIDKFESTLNSVYHSNRNEHPLVS